MNSILPFEAIGAINSFVKRNVGDIIELHIEHHILTSMSPRSYGMFQDQLNRAFDLLFRAGFDLVVQQDDKEWATVLRIRRNYARQRLIAH